MKSLGPAWWFGLVLGLSLGVFLTGLLVDALPASSGGWKLVRSGSAMVATLCVVVGGWLHRRSRGLP
jgi:hypothetical protein